MVRRYARGHGHREVIGGLRMKLDGVAAIVTGGASGLGRATATRLAAGGAKVVIVDLPTSDGDAVAKELGGAFAPGDVTSEGDLAAAVATAAGLGPLRIL